MEEIRLTSCEIITIPIIYRVLYTFRWLEMGFLNHQQYYTNSSIFPEIRELPLGGVWSCEQTTLRGQVGDFCPSTCFQNRCAVAVHPTKQTWHLQGSLPKRKVAFQTSIFRFYGRFREGICEITIQALDRKIPPRGKVLPEKLLRVGKPPERSRVGHQE